jgi:hypothetical protein
MDELARTGHLRMALATDAAASSANWPMFGHDPARSGVDAGDTILTRNNVSKLVEKWQISLGGQVAASTPIFLDQRQRNCFQLALQRYYYAAHVVIAVEQCECKRGKNHRTRPLAESDRGERLGLLFRSERQPHGIRPALMRILRVTRSS